MYSLDPNYLERRLRYSSQDVTTLTQLGEFKGKQALFARQSPEVLKSLKTIATIESAESSNRIEGITAPKMRIRDLVLESTTPKNRSEQEITGYRDALSLIHESHEEMPITVGVIRQLHATLYRYLPSPGGNFKMADNEIIQRNLSGTVTVRFKALSAAATPAAMQTLVDVHEGSRGHYEPLVVIPLAILDFLCIHPFTDGNGRTARLLTLLLLYKDGHRVGRYISLERLFEETKETYYESLERSSKGWHEGEHDGMPWVRYFWGVLLRAYREFEERVGRLRTGRGAKADVVRTVVENRLLPFSMSDIGKECPGISRDTIRNVLRELRDKGLIESRGKGRGARWHKLDRTDS